MTKAAQLTTSNRLIGYALAVLAAAGWSTGGLISKWLFSSPSAATEGWPIQPLGIYIEPTVLSGARALSATIILGILLAIFDRKSLRLSSPIRSVAFLAPFGAIAMAGMHYTYFKTVSLTNVATAILLEYLAPIITLFVGVIWFKHPLKWQGPVGVVLSIIGCGIVVGAFSPGGLTISTTALIWGLVSAVFFALYTLMGSRGNQRFGPFTLLWYGLFFAACMWLIVLTPARVLAPFGQWQTASAILVIACISTIIPFGAYLVALRYISATNATVTAMLEPVLAGLGAWLLFSEPVTMSLIIGGLLVIFAISIIQISDNNEDHTFPPLD